MKNDDTAGPVAKTHDVSDEQFVKQAPRGLWGSGRWLFGRNKWVIMLSIVAVSITLLLASLGIGVSEVAGSTTTAVKTFGIAFFAVRLVVVTLLLTYWLPFTKGVLVRLAKHPEAGEALAQSRYRIYFYYLLLEAFLFFV